jgi:replicative DNA helicase
MELLDRQPPCDMRVERAILGSVLLDPSCLDDIAHLIRPEDFYDDANQRLFQVMAGRHDKGKRIDVALLVSQLKKEDSFDLVGGTKYLAELADSVPNAAHARHYASIVRDHSTMRKLIHAGTEIVKAGYDDDDASAAAEKAESLVFAVLGQRLGQGERPILELMHAAMDRVDARLRGEIVGGGVSTGFTDLDAMTGGLHNSELTILAARPSMGKSACALNVAENVAADGKAVLIVSLEMSETELSDRLLCSVARVNGHRARNGTVDQADRQRMMAAAGTISAWDVFIDDRPSRRMAEISSMARRLKRKPGLDLLIIDYLQLIEPEKSRDNRQEQVAQISRRMKALAKELDVPVLCLCQLSRQTEAATGNIPRLSHLRESGAIEQDADVVMFVHRPEYYLQGEAADAKKGEAEIHVAKQRSGPTGQVELVWRADFTRFENKAPQRHDDFEPPPSHNKGVPF